MFIKYTLYYSPCMLHIHYMTHPLYYLYIIRLTLYINSTFCSSRMQDTTRIGLTGICLRQCTLHIWMRLLSIRNVSTSTFTHWESFLWHAHCTNMARTWRAGVARGLWLVSVVLYCMKFYSIILYCMVLYCTIRT